MLLENYGEVTVIADVPGKPRWSGGSWVPDPKDPKKTMYFPHLPSPCIIGSENPTKCIVACNLSGHVFTVDKNKLK